MNYEYGENRAFVVSVWLSIAANSSDENDHKLLLVECKTLARIVSEARGEDLINQTNMLHEFNKGKTIVRHVQECSRSSIFNDERCQICWWRVAIGTGWNFCNVCITLPMSLTRNKYRNAAILKLVWKMGSKTAYRTAQTKSLSGHESLGRFVSECEELINKTFSCN